MGSYRRLLLNVIGIFSIAITVATMSPNGRVVQAENIFESGGFEVFPAPAPFGPGLESSAAFHFLDPIAPSSGDLTKFDAAYLNYLTVEVCEVSLNSCLLVKTFTSKGTTSEQIRIESASPNGKYYIVNWDTPKSLNRTKTYRISVRAGEIELGFVDLSPSIYLSFGRTWPIKFLIEKDPALRVRLFTYLGKSCSQIAQMLKTEFGLSAADAQVYMANDPEPCSQSEIDMAIDGVYQNVIIPATTKVSDETTRNALIYFDSVGGKMIFAVETPLLKNLKTGDVLVSEPGQAAPVGYIRKVTSIKKSKTQIVLDTVQAKINEAVTQGVFKGAGELLPGDLAPESVEAFSKTKTSESTMSLAAEAGDNFNFHRDIDVTIDLEGADGDVSGTGKVRIEGAIDFNAGWDMGFGVEDCFDEFPPICVDRVEAHVNVDQKSTVKVTGNFNGHLNKEEKIDTIHFNPITFFIGPIPVVIVPEIEIIAGVTGNAHADFVFNAHTEAAFKAGLKWTDPDDNGKGWEQIKEYTEPTGDGNGTLNIDLDVEGYAKGHAKLLLYGIAGPGIAASLGLRAEVHTGQSPLWRIWAHILGKVTFSVDIGGVIDIGNHEETVLDKQFEIKAAENLKPDCFVSNDDAKANVTVPTFLGPTGGGLVGFFDCKDPEGDVVNYTAKANGAPIDPTRVTFNSSGTYTIEITATDPQGKANIFSFPLTVVNSPPIVTVATVSTTVGAGVQYFITAAAYDWESQSYLPCSSMQWTVTDPDQITVSSDNRSCTAVVIFAQQGERVVSVKATDPQGGSSTRNVPVTVTSAPSNAAPVIDIESFLVTATEGPKDSYCVTGFNCEVPYGGILFNGIGDYHQPLTLSLSASDPNGDSLSVKWYCGEGSNETEAAYNSDGTVTCSPGVPGSWASYVRAVVSDGTTDVNSEIRHFVMLQNPN